MASGDNPPRRTRPIRSAAVSTPDPLDPATINHHGGRKPQPRRQLSSSGDNQATDDGAEILSSMGRPRPDPLRFHYGLHNGSTFAQVLERDPVYCRDLLNRYENVTGAARVTLRGSLSSRELYSFVCWLRSSNVTIPANDSVTIPVNNNVLLVGTHRGKSYNYVYNSFPGYCDWVLRIESPTPALFHFQQFVRHTRLNRHE